MERASVQRTIRISFSGFSHFTVMEIPPKSAVFQNGQFGTPGTNAAGKLKQLSPDQRKQIHGYAFRARGYRCRQHKHHCQQYQQSFHSRHPSF